jgi:hypothetical protein
MEATMKPKISPELMYLIFAVIALVLIYRQANAMQYSASIRMMQALGIIPQEHKT